jgi:protein-S-isoprenylcysteine O-methyltransferase Ste14
MVREATPVTPLKMILTAVYMLIYPALTFGLAGDWSWIEGWVFNVWFLVLCGGTIIYLYRKDPALLAERYRRPGTGGEKGWDKYFIYAFLSLFTVWFVLMPLDAKRFRWSPEFPLWLKAVGFLILIVSSFFLFRAFSDNTFLSPLVRIQAERRHTVVSTGVYAVVRHPMYLGAACLFLGTPVLLGSFGGLALGALMVFMMMARIVGEEKMLAAELEGYADYRRKVKYRLLPFIW